ncbi:MAG: hypothetical protein LBV67_12515 [Streptococcaceae bacterium]|jgi:hypothetical protein|nr:hypothetical protein [Streptococcaceae bacterium]
MAYVGRRWCAGGVTYGSGGDIAKIMDFKNKITVEVDKLIQMPSFDGQTITVKAGQPITLTDTNGVISRFVSGVNNPNNLNYSINGDQLTLSADASSIQGSGKIEFKYDLSDKPAAVWKSTAFGNPNQTMFSYGDEPFNEVTTVNVVVEKQGSLEIKKVDKQTGDVVPGTKFHVTFSDGSPAQDVTTGADGTATLTDAAADGATATVTETSVPAPYILDPTPQTVTIVSAQTVHVTAKNSRQQGRVRIDKTLLNNIVTNGGGKQLPNGSYAFAGIQFDLLKDSPTGAVVDTVTLDANGLSNWSKYVDVGQYYLKEKPVANSTGQITNGQAYPVKISYGGASSGNSEQTITADNKPVHGQITIKKQDLKVAPLHGIGIIH